MKNSLVLCLLAFASGMFFACSPENKQPHPEKEMFTYNIAVDIEGLQGPVVLIDGATKKPLNTVYAAGKILKMRGELSVDNMHKQFMLHFPSKYHNPYMFPVDKVGSIYFNMDTNTSVKGHYDTLMLAKVENTYLNSLHDFKEKNFPSIIALKQFIMDGVYAPGARNRSQQEQKAYAEKGNALNQKVANALIEKTGQFPKSELMAAVLASKAGLVGYEKLDSLAQLFDQSIHSSLAYQNILQMLDYMKKRKKPQALEVGQFAPDFKLNDAEGNTYSLSDYKGKYVILDFWASWCGPCKKEMPFMKKLYEKYHAKGLEMIAISTDEKREAWLKAKNKLNMPYLQLHDKNQVVSNAYLVRGIPYVVLINPKGVIIAIERGEALEKIIQQKLKA